MLRRSLLILALLAAGVLPGCAFAPVVPPRGLLYNDQRAPLFGGKETGTKEGKASAYSVLMMVGWGDASLDAAARNGSIKQVKHVDYELYSILGMYQKFTTIVRGE
jgi:hypothetical protein